MTYSFGCFIFTFQPARKISGVRNVVSNTSQREMPSTPRPYVIPNCGIQRMLSSNCMPALPSSQPRSRPRERTKTAAAEKSPQPLAMVSVARGMKASTIAARIGSQRMVESNGINRPRCHSVVVGCQLSVVREVSPEAKTRGQPTTENRQLFSCEKCDEHDDPDKKHQRVIADIASLEEPHDVAESSDDIAEHRGQTVDHGVDALPEETRDRGQRTDDDQRVQLIDV